MRGRGDGYYFLGIPDDIGVLFRQAYNAKARIHSNSWGVNWLSEYTLDSANADEFIWTHPDMTITFSAGNNGLDANLDGLVDTCTPGGQGVAGCLMTTQAVAKNVITVGASENVRADYACDPSQTYLRAVWPDFGQETGGTEVTLMGAGFLNGATVSFGGTFSTAVSVINPTTITAITPAGVAALPGEAAIALDVVVANPDGTSGTLYRAFTYVASPDPEEFLPIPIPVACSELLSLEIAFKLFLKMRHNCPHGKESFESSCQLAGVPPVPSLGAVPKGLEAERHRRGFGGYQRVDQPVGKAS